MQTMFEEIIDPKKVGLSKDRLKRIEVTMQKYIDKELYAGLSTMVCRKGSLVQKSYIGYADIASRKNMSLQIFFQFRRFVFVNPLSNASTHNQKGPNRVARASHCFRLGKVLVELGLGLSQNGYGPIHKLMNEISLIVI